MGKGKLEKFADMREYPHVFEYPYSVADNVTFDMKGNWNRDFFKNDNPIVLELGCGRGETQLEMDRRIILGRMSLLKERLAEIDARRDCTRPVGAQRTRTQCGGSLLRHQSARMHNGRDWQ